MSADVYRPDLSIKGKLRRRLVRLRQRRPAPRGPARAAVTFSFDDAPDSATGLGAALLAQRGMRATYFVAAGLAGTVAHLGRYADRDEVRRLAAEGHEVASHTYSHLDCGRVTAEALAADLDRNARAFADWGLPPARTFAYPYGDVGAATKAVAASRFALCRGVHAGLLGEGSDLNQAPAIAMDGEAGEARAHAALERAASRGEWLILFAHQVTPEVGEFAVAPEALARLLDAARGRGLDVVTAAEGASALR